MSSRKKLRCNRCGKFVDTETDKPYHGQEEGSYCRREFVDSYNSNWSCGGNIYWWEETYNLYDKVVHPNIYNGNEVFTIVAVMHDHLILKGDWSGIGHPDQESTVSKNGWIIHSRVHWRRVLKDTFKGT
jgi:hypothetical protein